MSREDGELSEMGCQLNILSIKTGKSKVARHGGLLGTRRARLALDWRALVPSGLQRWGLCLCLLGGGSDIIYAHMPSMQSVT